MSEQNKKTSILIVDDIPDNVGILLEYLSSQGFKTYVAEDGESAIEQVLFRQPELILLDVMMPGIDGFETCRRLKQLDIAKNIPVIFMTALSETEDKVKGFQAGAVDYITKPFRQEEVLARVNTHLKIADLQNQLLQHNEHLDELVRKRTSQLADANDSLKAALTEVRQLKDRLQMENAYLKEEIKLNHNFEEIITNSVALKGVLRQVEQVAPTDSTTLILGETGTGKELIARAIHNFSKRKTKPLVKVNCASLPANLIESELFGHEKGAFTGALAKKIGRFELAHRGAIFLDEIGDLPLELQSKLLRVLQEGEFERLGNSETLKIDVRVIAATNRDLLKQIQQGQFREDLYYRLNVFPVHIPPLRERSEDIPLLVEHFVRKFSQKMGKKITQIPSDVLNELSRYRWPGNVRELENVIERAVILTQGDSLHVDRSFIGVDPNQVQPEPVHNLSDVEREHIIKELNQCNWLIEGKRGAAKRLGLAPSTLRDRMRKLGISRPY